MKPARFTSLAPTDNDRMNRNTFKSNQASPITNTRWKRAEDDMHSNPFRRHENNKRFTNNQQKPVINSRWKLDAQEESVDQSRGGGGDFPNSFRNTRGRGRGDYSDRGGERGGYGNRGRGRGGFGGRSYGRDRDRDSFNSFNRKTKRAPKPTFNLETQNFPPLGKVESPTSLRPKMNFSKAAHTNKDTPGPKHIVQFPQRMPRTKKEEIDDRDPLDWNTDDEEGGCAAEDIDDRDPEPDWPAKGGYID